MLTFIVTNGIENFSTDSYTKKGGRIMNNYKTRSCLTQNEVVSTGDFIVGIDIGTTTISAIVIDINIKKAVKCYTVANDSKIVGKSRELCEQKTEIIFAVTKELIDSILLNFSNVRSIGLTGQMHGILYIDKYGNAVSDFVTWQDKRGNIKITDRFNTCEIIENETGEKIPTGCGFTTLYYDYVNKQISGKAYTFCNITDYVAMKLVGRSTPLIHSSNAAGFGFYDLENNSFKSALIQKLGIDIKLPEITDKYVVLGKYNSIPVSIGIGDNQASFLGSVSAFDDTVLVNIGTGSQISIVIKAPIRCDNALEVRPLVSGKYLLCKAELSGGASYALLEKFFRRFAFSVTGESKTQYDVLNELALKAYLQKIVPLDVRTDFYGTRENPLANGAILNITEKNFTPETLVLGFLDGICRKLYNYFDDKLSDKKLIVASGNAVQKNKVLPMIIRDIFGLPVKLLASSEEASFGAALFGAVSSNILSSDEDFKYFINYI